MKRGLIIAGIAVAVLGAAAWTSGDYSGDEFEPAQISFVAKGPGQPFANLGIDAST